jgi:fatty-acyl-CoA synthase
LVKPGTLPKTSSGKLQRAKCRELYLAGELELVV